MSEVYQVKGEVLLAKADLRGAIRQFDEAIRLDESNPVPLYNKGLTLIQMNQFEAHNAQKLFEAALKVDPTCMARRRRGPSPPRLHGSSTHGGGGGWAAAAGCGAGVGAGGTASGAAVGAGSTGDCATRAARAASEGRPGGA